MPFGQSQGTSKALITDLIKLKILFLPLQVLFMNFLLINIVING